MSKRDERVLAAGLILAAVIMAAPATLTAAPAPAQWLAQAVTARTAAVDQRRVLAELLATMRSLSSDSRTVAADRPYAPMPIAADRSTTRPHTSDRTAPPLAHLLPGLLNLPPPHRA